MQWDESRNLVFVNAAATFGWDSNIFAAADAGGDTYTTARFGVEYQRRAGLIGVNGNVGWNVARFEEHPDENYNNPFARLEFTKDSGRTTGSLVLGASRDSRAEPEINRRTDSWNYDAGLHLRYPVIERYTVSGSFTYQQRDYRDNRVLVDLATYGASTDLYYVFTSERDLVAGYRIRFSDTSADTSFEDHSFTAGLTGRILPKLNGTLRGGYQLRYGRGPQTENHDGYTVAGSATWSINRRASVTVQLSKDFSTASTNVSIDSVAATADALYVFNRRLAAGAGVGVGRNRFLGERGRDREDTYSSAHVAGHYTLMEGVRVSLTYSLYDNRSTLAISDFARHSVSLSISSRF